MDKALAAASKIVVPYLAVGTLYIYFSDTALEGLLGNDIARLSEMQTYKGLAFIAVTATLLFALTTAVFRRIHSLQELDDQTGLLNQAMFVEYLDDALERGHGRKQEMLVVFADIDNFNLLSQEIGREASDRFLQDLGSQLRKGFSGDTLLSRVGSDEFCLAISRQPGNGKGWPDRTLAHCQHVFLAGARACGRDLTFSFGAALYPGDARGAHHLLAAAKNALRKSAQGDGSISYFNQALAEAERQRQQLVNALRHAISEDQLTINYQPQIRLRDMGLSGCEVLVRWRGEDGEWISPELFVPVAERHNLIRPLTERVLALLARDLREHPLLDAVLPRISVNISTQEFLREDFFTWITSQIDQLGPFATRLQLELTEHVVVSNVGLTIERMNALRARGIRFSLDDFGTGYSSLAAIKDLPINELKIDKSFTRDICQDPKALGLTKTITRLADSLQLSVVAEGVET